jgi:hypothetical protein
VYLLLLATAFAVSTSAVSNLMPLLPQIARSGLSISNAASLAANLVAAIASVGFLARAIYRVDKRAGRIRNKVGWFE